MKEQKKFAAAAGAVFLLIWLLNALMPLSYGDDYVYSFVWDGSDGWNMLMPMPEDARRVGSFSDLFASQWSHYFTWGGRMPAHVLVQLFLWQGKAWFDVLDALVFVLLLLEIHWISTGGRVTLHVPAFRFLWIFFAAWAFVPGFQLDILWLTGSCNYLWMLAVLLGFLLPWIRWAFDPAGAQGGRRMPLGMFLFGILAGWTNENTVCWAILYLGFLAYRARRAGTMPRWMPWGLLGLCVGYAFLVFAPGNQVRQAGEIALGGATGWALLSHSAKILGIALAMQFFLWHFLWHAWREREHFGTGEMAGKQLFLVKSFAFLSVASLGIMMLAPTFPIRAGFGSTIFLIVAAASMLQLQQMAGYSHLGPALRKALRGIGACYLAVTVFFTVYGYVAMKEYTDYVDGQARQAAGTGREVTVRAKHVLTPAVEVLSGFHHIDEELKEDPMWWANTAYARYWGIASIRVEEEK